MFTPPHLLDGARWAGMRVGIFGGSFNPPHIGHLHVSQIAKTALNLDAVWWLVTPQNPLKDSSELASFDERFDQCLALTAGHPGILVSDLEQQLGRNQSYYTIKSLCRHFPQTRFVWVTGMDNAHTMHRWHHWKSILKLVATAHIARPPAWTLIKQCPLRQLKQQNHHVLDRAQNVSLAPGNTYWLMQKRMLDISSTKIRKNL